MEQKQRPLNAGEDEGGPVTKEQGIFEREKYDLLGVFTAKCTMSGVMTTTRTCTLFAIGMIE